MDQSVLVIIVFCVMASCCSGSTATYSYILNKLSAVYTVVRGLHLISDAGVTYMFFRVT